MPTITKQTAVAGVLSSFFTVLAAVLLFGMASAALGEAGAAEYSVSEVGEWLNTEYMEDSLAHALQVDERESDVILRNSLTTGWSDWKTAGAFTLLQTLNNTKDVTFQLAGNTLGGVVLDMVSGSGGFTFTDGSLGASGTNFGIGATGNGSVNLEGVTLTADTLWVGGATTAGALELDTGSVVAASRVELAGYGSSITVGGGSSLTADGDVRITEGGRLDLASGSDTTIHGNLTIGGVGIFEARPGVYKHNQSTLNGDGALHFNGDELTVHGGALLDLTTFSNLGSNGYAVNAGQSLLVDGIFTHAPMLQSFQTGLVIDGDLAASGGVVTVSDGANLSGAADVHVHSDGELVVKGGVNDSLNSGTIYFSTLQASGDMVIGEASGAGTVTVADGGEIKGLQNIAIGNEGSGSLLVEGYNAATKQAAKIEASGALSVGKNAEGTLELIDGGSLTVQNAVIGEDASGTVKVDGVAGANSSSSLEVKGDLTLAQGGDASMSVNNGALVLVSGDAILGDLAGVTATLNITGLGGVGSSYQSQVNPKGTLTVGNAGKAVVNIASGGRISSGGASVAAAEEGSEARITMSGSTSLWAAGGAVVSQDDYTAPLGNTSLTVTGGTLQVNGLFAMAGQSSSYDNGFGVASFQGGGAELFLKNGAFYNRDQTGGIGRTSITGGAIVSGTGHMYSGDIFTVNGGIIAAGIRNMHNFDPWDGDKLTGLGTIHIHDNDTSTTQFYNTTFLTKLDRGDLPDNSDGLSDRVVVYGDLDMDDHFKVSISRPLDGEYLLISTDGGTITNFTPQNLNGKSITLNGKLIDGNDRLENGLSTELRNGDTEVWLTVGTGGNVKTWWTGNAGGQVWDMTARNFDAGRVTSGNDQFLDGDTVVFDFAKVAAGQRTANVTEDAFHYAGNLAPVANVLVSEVQVLGGAAADKFVWNGGSILAYDSALYSTFDSRGGGSTPSGQLVKIGDGTLEINNANEFYGGIHLGKDGAGGGTIVLKNEKGFGAYDSSSGYINMGQVFIHEDAKIDVSGVDSVNNRFIVENGKTLTFELGDNGFNISGNNALYSKNGGRGGGIYIGNQGKVLYSGTGTLNVTRNLAQQGGGLYADRMANDFDKPVNVMNNYAALNGGGIYADGDFSLKDGSVVSGNATQGFGGGIAANDGKVTIHGNTVVKDNLSGMDVGGGIYMHDFSTLVLSGARETVGAIEYGGGDIWFEGNYVSVGFDQDDPAGGGHDLSNATRNAVHLTRSSTMKITGPYNTYFYDPVSGAPSSKIEISGKGGTVIFRDDSAMIGNTEITNQATFRLESSDEGPAVYGRKAQTGSNRFTAEKDTTITGSGTIMANAVYLNGTIDLDAGTFTRPDDRDGSGRLDLSDGQKQGTLAIEGDVQVADTAKWTLNLGSDGSTDLITVAGNVTFLGQTPGKKLSLTIDELHHGRYLVMSSSGTIGNYTTDRKESDATVWYHHMGTDTDIDLTKISGDDAGRLRVTSYVAPDAGTGQSLYLDIAGRNRHVGASGGGNWGFDPSWIYDNDFAPINTGSNVSWSKKDTGPNTNVYLDGDMVTLEGGTYTLIGDVNPADLFVSGTGDVEIRGSGAITTFTTSESTIPAKGPEDTTILPAGSPGSNDYGIPYYTGKLVKTGSGTLTFSNTGTNYFTEGIDVGSSGSPGDDAGMIVFGSGEQLRVGSGGRIHFLANGTLKATESTSLNTAVDVDAGKTATIDVGADIALSGVKLFEGDGGIEKTGSGSLKLGWANTFTGGTELRDGDITLEHAESLSSYTTTGGTSGLVKVSGDNTSVTLNADGATFRNHFAVTGNNWTLKADSDGTIGNVVSNASGGAITLAGNKSMTLANDAAITFSGNSGISGANDIHIASGASLRISGAGNVFINSGIAGVGDMQKSAGSGITQIGADSDVSGNTVVSGGTFRVVAGKTFGNPAATFTADSSTIAGGGTIKAGGIITIGLTDPTDIDPDQAALSVGATTVAPENRFGTLTFDGVTTLGDNFTYQYDTDNNGNHDLIQVANGLFTVGSGTVNLRKTGSLSGEHLLMVADDTIIFTHGLQGLTATANGNPIENTATPRGSYRFRVEDSGASIGSELWLKIQYNSLNMVWQGGDGEWSASSGASSWASRQTKGDTAEHIFANGDYAHFLTPAGKTTITIEDAGVLVSGFDVDSGEEEYLFTGAGGITAKKSHASIEGDYLPDGGSEPTLTPDGKLNKRGGGTLTFANTGNNTFDEGIDIHAGTIAFDRGEQLGDGGKGITFLGDGALQSNDDVTLASDLHLSNGVTAALNSGDDKTFTLTGKISVTGDAGNLSKDGAGTVVLTNEGNMWSGSTVVNAGTLQANGVKTLGDTSPSRIIAVASGAALAVENSNDETLALKVSGGGNFIKAGTGALILTNDNTYLGDTIIKAGTLAIAADSRLGDAGDIILGGGTLRVTETFGTDRRVLLGEDGGALEVDSAASREVFTVNGVVTDLSTTSGATPGDLEKTGEGALVLTNQANAYRGDTVISAGRLVAGGLGTLGANVAEKSISTTRYTTAPGEPERRSQLELRIDDVATLHQKLTGDGEVIKTGSGALTLQDDSDYAGRLIVEGGVLTLNGNYGQTDSFRIMNGATLSGTGVIGGGVVERGGSIVPRGVNASDPKSDPTSKPLTVDGGLTFASGSLYGVTITQYPGSGPLMQPVSDTIVVKNGTVTIEPGALLSVGIDYWSGNLDITDFGANASDRFTIINAEDAAVADTGILFSLLDAQAPRGVELVHGWNDNGKLYQLWFEGDPMSTGSIAQTHDQQAVSGELGLLALNRDPGMRELQIILAQKAITDDMLLEAYNQMAGDIRANSLTMALKKPWRHPFGRMDSMLSSCFGSVSRDVTASTADLRGPKSELWSEAYGQYTDVRDDGNAYGYDVRRKGLAVGYHHQLSPRSLLGFTFNYSDSDLKQETGKATLDDFEFGVYNVMRFDNLFDVKTYLGYGRQKYKFTRRVHIPSSGRYDAVHEEFREDTNGHSFSGSIELSRSFSANRYLSISPVLAYDHEQVRQKGFRESGGMTALDFKSATQKYDALRVGVRFDFALPSRVDLSGHVYYTREFNRQMPRSEQYFTNATTATKGMDIWGVRRGRDGLNIGLSAEYHLNRQKNIALSLQYDADIKRRESSHTGNVGISYQW